MISLSHADEEILIARLYLDGRLVGQIANTSTYFGEDGTQLLVPGARPLRCPAPSTCAPALTTTTPATLTATLPILVGPAPSCERGECVTGKHAQVQ